MDVNQKRPRLSVRLIRPRHVYTLSIDGVIRAKLARRRSNMYCLLGIDGMHAVDFYNCAHGIAGANGGDPYCPNMAALSKTAINYVAASSSKPSDCNPGDGRLRQKTPSSSRITLGRHQRATARAARFFRSLHRILSLARIKCVASYLNNLKVATDSRRLPLPPS